METHRNREAEDEVRQILSDEGFGEPELSVALDTLKEAGFVFRIDTGFGRLAEMGVLVHSFGDPDGLPYRRLVMQQRWRVDAVRGDVVGESGGHDFEERDD